MSIKSERDAYKEMFMHLALAFVAVAVSAAVSVGICFTHNAWCLLGLIVIVMAYSIALGEPMDPQYKEESESA